jgi:outer membrane lipoprotein-sorting protein
LEEVFALNIRREKMEQKNRVYLFISFLLSLTSFSFAFALSSPLPDEIARRSQIALFYQGKDMKARIYMRLLSRDGKERIREMTMLRKNLQEGGDQRYYIYFYQPADVRDTTFMVYKYPKKDDDRWLFIPALNLVKRIAAADKNSSFVGSDFSYEDVSGRDIEDDSFELIKEEPLGEADTYVLKAVPKDLRSANYSYKVSWIDKRSLLPIKEEYYDKRGSLYKLFTADEIKDVRGIPTITRRTMKNLQTGQGTEVVFREIEYNVGLEDEIFTERFLKKPPEKWIR